MANYDVGWYALRMCVVALCLMVVGMLALLLVVSHDSLWPPPPPEVGLTFDRSGLQVISSMADPQYRFKTMDHEWLPVLRHQPIQVSSAHNLTTLTVAMAMAMATVD
jgi:hypothetical protein